MRFILFYFIFAPGPPFLQEWKLCIWLKKSSLIYGISLLKIRKNSSIDCLGLQH